MFDFTKIPGQKLDEKKVLIKDMKPVISVITPFYNAGSTFEQTYKCLMNQTFSAFEWIIVNDGSTNKEDVKVLKNIAKKDNRIKVFDKENGGPSLARDYAVSKSSKSSKYLFFLDSDDLVNKTILDCLYWTLELHPDYSFAYSTLVNFGKRNFLWERYLTVEQEKTENLISICAMVKKEDFLEVKGFEITEKAMYEDWNLWLKLLAAGKKPIRISAPLFWYRESNAGELSRAQGNHEKAMFYVNKTAKLVNNNISVLQFPTAGKMYEKILNINVNYPKYKNDKTNILFIFPWMVVGGADVFNIELIKRLDKKKYATYIVTTLPNENPTRQLFEEVADEVFDLASFMEPYNYYTFVSYLINSRNISKVFVSNSIYGYDMIPLIKEEFPEIKIVDYIHSIDKRDKRGGFGTYSKTYENYIDKTLTCNNFTKEELKKEHEISNVDTLYIGTDPDKFNIKNFDKNKIKEKYAIPKNKKIVSIICRLATEKRVDLFLKIAKKLLDKRDDLFFIVAGDGDEYKKIQKLAKKLNISKNVLFTGMLEKPEEIHAINDVFVICSMLEGLALTSYESLSMGVPVVTSDVGGQKELIDNNVGYIVPFYKNFKTENEEIEEYCKGIEYCLTNHDKLSKNCRQKIVEKFNYKNMVQEFTKFINENNKVQKPKINNKLIYELAIRDFYNDIKWMADEYNIDHFGEIYEQVLNNKSITSSTLGSKIRKTKVYNKIKFLAKKMGITPELKAFLNLFRIIKQIIINIAVLILRIFITLISIFKLIIKLLIFSFRKWG